MIGQEQQAWLTQQLHRSSATWQVLGQQVLMGRMNIPAPILMETIQPGAGVSVSQYAALAARARMLLAAPPDPPATIPYTLSAMQDATLSVYDELYDR